MQSNSPTAYGSLGLSSPRKTFLDGRGGTAPTSRPTTSQKVNISPTPPATAKAPQTAEAVLLVEHKVEITDMLQESLALLDNAYRSKQVFGDHLRYVDPSYSGDGVLKLQLNTPPTFDPSYGTSVSQAAEPQTLPRSSSNQMGDGELQRKLRTAEELIKKLFKKNTQLEVENKYFRDELARMDRLVGLSRAPQHTIQVHDGHQPLDHPLFTAETRRRCRSCPPSRTLMRTAVNGFGLTFTPDEPSEDQQGQSAENANGLRKRIVQLTESLVAVQHENDLLVREKQSRVSHRDRLLNHYLVMRDKQLAQLRWSLQQTILKVNNPAKLFRARQPNPGTNPVVATNNILKEVSQRLVSEIASVADEIMLKSDAIVGGGQETWGQGSVESVGTQRRELVQRLRAITDTLPLAKKKQLLNLFSEVRQLFDSLVEGHRCLLNTYDTMRRTSTHDVVQLKLEVSLLKDQLRSGGRQ